MRIIEKPRDNFKRYALVLLALGFLLGSFLLYFKDNEVEAADATKFNPGNIIDDAVFYDYTTMTASDIQNFLNSKVSKCESGYTCLKDYSSDTVAKSADAYCSGYNASSSQTAAQIIYGVAQSCKINPQALLVILQKEMGLVTHTGPGSWRYKTAMGMGCPDTAACDSQYYGLFNQLYGAARQYRIYQAKPSSYNYVAGRNNTILWSPTSSCGSSTVYIENQATAGLYNYTPYRPNQAALNAGYGTGDSCSAYGNRNFYLYFTDWFGSTQSSLVYSLTSKKTNNLSSESTLKPGEFLTSPNGKFILIMQYSGQLALYTGGSMIWQSETVNWDNKDSTLRIQGDGNLVLYKSNGTAIWASGTSGQGSVRLTLQDDGNLVLYKSNGTAIWASGTSRSVATTTHIGDSLKTGGALSTDQYLRSPDWRYFLYMQSDGNLVLYTAGHAHALWGSGTDGKGGKYVTMQNDGNLVIYSDSKALWGSGTDGKGGTYVSMQNDGNLVVYSNTRPLWGSGTDGKGGGNTKYDDCTLAGNLQSGNQLKATEFLCSSNLLYKLIMQSDGNLVMYYKVTSANWSSGTNDKFFKSNLAL